MTLFHAAALLLAALFVLVEVAKVPIPLPLPARSPDVLFDTWMLEPPAGLPPLFPHGANPSLPQDPRGDRLRGAARLFSGGPLRGGVETVAPTRDGRGLAMVDGRGRLWRAVRRDAGGGGASRGTGQARAPTFELSPAVPLANLTPGLTTGAALSPDGRLAYFANAPLGLVRVDMPPWEEEGEEGGEAAPPSSSSPPRIPRITYLANRVDADDPIAPGAELLFPDGLDVVAADDKASGGGKKNSGDNNSNHVVYFSSATDIPPLLLSSDNTYDGVLPALLSICKGQPRGMLLAHYPGNGSTRALVGPGGATSADPQGKTAPSGGLWFANGVAVSHDGQSVLVADSVQAAIRRYWLAGPKQGTLETFADRLPGAPDGIARAADGKSYWVAIFGPLPPPFRWSHVRLVRAVMAWAPQALRPKEGQNKEGLVLRLDGETGAVMDVYADRGGKAGVWGVTSAVELEAGVAEGGWLLLGNLHDPLVRVVRVEEAEGERRRKGRQEAAAASGVAEDGEEEEADEWETEEEEDDDEYDVDRTEL
jgi:sugar lactone lactonase YvrE